MVLEFETSLHFLVPCTQDFWVYEATVRENSKGLYPFFRAKSGFQEEVDKMLVKDARVTRLEEACGFIVG